MALRATDEEISNSPILGLNYFGQDAGKLFSQERGTWEQHFEVAALARRSISMNE